jgi:tetratricopeptide (TPR) repeat protein
LIFKADIFLEDDRYEDAIDSYDKALDLDCSKVDVRHKKCNLLYEMKEYDRTIICCEANLEIDPTHKESINLKNSAEIKKAEMEGRPIKGRGDGINNSVYQEILDS